MNTVSTTATAWPFEKLDGTSPWSKRGKPRGRTAAALRVSATGHASLSAAAMDVLGWADGLLIAAKDGVLIIKAAGADDHRAYRVVYATNTSTGVRGNCRFCAGRAFAAAGLLPAIGSVKYVCVECDAGDGERALYVRRDVQLPVLQYERCAAVSAVVNA